MNKVHHKIGKFLHHHCFCERGILRLRALFVVSMIAFLVTVVVFPSLTEAAALTALSDTMSRLQKDELSNHTIRFTTPTGAGDAADTIEITMPTGFNIGLVDYTDIDLSCGAVTGYETDIPLAATADATHWGASFTGQVLSLDHATDGGFGDIAGTNKVVVEIGTNASGGDQQIDNHATAAAYTISIAGDFGDTGKIGIVILDDDQFDVTGTVDPTITFSLSATATDFGTLSATSVTTSVPNITLTISTNAGSGYAITVQDEGNATNPGLYNAGSAFTIGSADYSYADSADLSAVAGYGIQGTSATATIDARYDLAGDNVGGYERTAQSLATFNSAASSHTVTITSKAKITGATPSGSYVDTVTVIATGQF